MSDFDQDVRRAMTDVVDHTQPSAGFTERLIANSREGRVTITPLERARRGSRWTTPLLAAAIVILLAGGVVIGKEALGSHKKQAPVHPSPSVTTAPTHVTTPSPSPTPSHPTFSATQVYFSDATHGWAIGTDHKRASLLRTTNGTQWTSVPLPSGLRPPTDSSSCGDNGTITGPCVDNVLFADAQHGYLWSLHELYLTSDGGKHWSREPHSPGHTGATQLVVFGSHVLRMRPIADCSSGCIGRLQLAAIGSSEWTTVTPATSALYQSSLAVHGATAYFDSGDYAGGKGGGVFRSADGVRWTKVAARPCGDAYYEMVAGFDGSVAVDCEAAHQTLRIAKAGSSTFGAGRRLPGNSASLVAVLSSQNILAIDGRTLYRSTNDGVSFARVGTVGIDATHGVVPSAVSADFLYAPSPSGRLLVSTDGGTTWQTRTF